MTDEVSEEVGARALAAEDRGLARRPVGRVPGTLERLPRGLEEEAVLRIEEARFAREHPEEGSVEEVRPFEDGPALDVARVLQELLGNAFGEELVVGEGLDALDPAAE